VDWSAGKVELLAEARPWEPDGHPRRAGVSSFGASGTNAHLILEEAPSASAPGEARLVDGGEPGEERRPQLAAVPLPLAAKSGDALEEAARRLTAHLRRHPEIDPVDAGASLATRPRLPHRAVAIGSDRQELLAALDALGAGEPDAAVARGRAGSGRLAFVFGGQGSQWAGMGRELLDTSPVFAGQVGLCEEALGPYLDFSIEEALRGGKEEAKDWGVELVQPALFTMMVSLAALWRSHGVEPAAVVGHSQGEIAAACVAGALSLEDAARVVALRSQAQVGLIGKGAMVSLRLPPERALELIEPWTGRIELAVINSPSSSVVSGDPAAVDELLTACEAEGVRTRNLGLGGAGHTSQMEMIRERVLADLAPVEPRASETTFYSSMTGRPLGGRELDADYWYRSMRNPVRFDQAIEALVGDGFDSFVEISVHPALTVAIEETAAALAEGAVTVTATGSLRRREAGPRRFLTALAEAHAGGVEVGWSELFARHGARPARLPTYPFQRRHYWPDLAAARSGDAVAIGQSSADHPLLGAAVSIPGGEEQWLLTGRLSLQSHPWLADHALLGTAIVPAAAFAELALRAAEQVGAEAVEELTIEAPLTLPEQGAVQVRVGVEDADGGGHRALAIHSQAEGAGGGWVRNASGLLSDEPVEADNVGEWPPADAEPVSADAFYDRTAALGADYGPAFQGVRAAWRRGEELFAEVELAEEQKGEAASFGIHPALLDAAFQTGSLDLEPGGAPRAPYALQGFGLYARGASSLRVRLVPVGEDAMGLVACDADGNPVFSMRSVAVRPIDPARLQGAEAADSLFELDWIELAPSAGDGGAAPRRFECFPAADLDPPAAAEALCAQALGELQAVIAVAGEEGEERVAFITRGALATGEGESADPAAAAVWGLVRSAQAEHPGRFLVVDSDAGEASAAALEAALTLATEPELALRQGRVLVPRLARAPEPETGARPFDPEATVAILGATGDVGRRLARHLVTDHGARRLLLASRRGPGADGAAELVAELEDLGAEAELVACDAADRAQLDALIASVPARHPLAAVFHGAAVTDDGLIASLDSERLATTMAPKAAAAWHLHELTREIEGCELILFSSVAASFQSLGQGNYAAANAFLDALSQRRRAEGLPGLSLAWGLWATGAADTTDLARVGREGIVAMPAERAFELFDRSRALAPAIPFLVAAELDLGALRSRALGGTIPPLLRGLVRVPTRRAGGPAAVVSRLAELPEAERDGVVRELVLGQVAAVLGHASSTAVDPGAAFKDLGFDSLVAVELRNRLAQATGLRLPATLIFDYPSAESLGRFLIAEIEGTETAAVDTDRKLDSIASILDSVPAGEKGRALTRLRSLLVELSNDGRDNDEPELDLDSASDEELFELIDGQLGGKR
jgi:acyl transferase domain-containing protein/acyl carrier protein